MRYCSTTTASHDVAKTYSSCIEDINDLITKEGYVCTSPLFTNTESILNMDEVETLFSASIGRLEKNKSMDMAFGIIDPENEARKQMLMVELKFNMTEFYGLRKQDLEGKVAGTQSLLTESIPIHKQYIFIFKSQHLQEALSRMYRMIPRLDSKYIALDIELLKTNFFS